VTTTSATFAIDLRPEEAGELDGAAGRFAFTKTWQGGISGTGRGFMASGGDPASGTAGYVALELVDGSVDGRAGTFLLQQFGTMAGGEQRLEYAVVPGSGTGELVGLAGTVSLTVADGVHRVELDYSL
jgi:hypothetical protein